MTQVKDQPQYLYFWHLTRFEQIHWVSVTFKTIVLVQILTLFDKRRIWTTSI